MGWLNRRRVVGLLVVLVVGASCGTNPDPDSDDAADVTGSESSSMTASSTSATGPSTDGPPQSCPGLPESFSPCRTPADCSDLGNYLECVPAGSDPSGGCGGATGCAFDWAQGAEPCANDEACNASGATDYVCREGDDPCCGPVSACVPRCTPDTCAEGNRCPELGVCEPVPCDDGFTCADGARCEPGVAGSDPHGCVAIPCDEAGALACPMLHDCVAKTCVRAPCASDDDCECGSCIAGQCWDRPWECYEPPS